MLQKLISQGEIMVNGKLVSEPGTKVTPYCDVRVNGRQIKARKERLFLHYKKNDVIVSHMPDHKGRMTLFPILHNMGIWCFVY